MSKTIISSIEKWPGSVIIADPLTLSQAQEIERAMEGEPDPEEIRIARETLAASKKEYGADDERTLQAMQTLIDLGEKVRIFLSVGDKQKEPAILACVEKWNLEGFSLTTDGSIPASPRKDSHKLIDWLFAELVRVYFGELEIPNVSSPTLISTPAPDAIPVK